jgi:predicted amidohydrolase
MALAAIQDALESGADLIVLPELVVSGYVFASTSEVEQVAISLQDEMFGTWSQAIGTSDAIRMVTSTTPRRLSEGTAFFARTARTTFGTTRNGGFHLATWRRRLSKLHSENWAYSFATTWNFQNLHET